MVSISQTTFWNLFSLMNMFVKLINFFLFIILIAFFLG